MGLRKARAMERVYKKFQNTTGILTKEMPETILEDAEKRRKTGSKFLRGRAGAEDQPIDMKHIAKAYTLARVIAYGLRANSLKLLRTRAQTFIYEKVICNSNAHRHTLAQLLLLGHRAPTPRTFVGK